MTTEQKQISSIEKQKGRPRYNVFVDDTYAFSVHEDILIKYRLSKGKLIETQEIELILQAEERHRAEQYGLRYLSYRPRTAQEIREYLRKKGFEELDCRAVLDGFVEKGYIDDQSFAMGWIEDRKRLKPRGRFMLKQELTHHGVDEHLADAMVEKHVSEKDEIRMIIQLLEKRFRTQTFLSFYELKKKAIPYLQRKGFPLDSIYSSLEQCKDRWIQHDHGEKMDSQET